MICPNCYNREHLEHARFCMIWVDVTAIGARKPGTIIVRSVGLMGKRSGYLAKQKARNTVLQDATRETYEQFMTDTLILTLNNPDVMGKDVFGHKRLKKVLEAWGRCYDVYFDALTNRPEADYVRQRMDDAMKKICGKSGDFVPFEKRYNWMPKITYEAKK